jgi:hypothetical protein
MSGADKCVLCAILGTWIGVAMAMAAGALGAWIQRAVAAAVP